MEVGEEEAGAGAPHRGRGVSVADQQAADMERFLEVRTLHPTRPTHSLQLLPGLPDASGSCPCAMLEATPTGCNAC